MKTATRLPHGRTVCACGRSHLPGVRCAAARPIYVLKGEVVRVDLGWLPALSKNSTHVAVDDRFVVTASAREQREAACLLVKSAMRGRVFRKGIVRLWITVYRPNARWDACNFVDECCDIVQAAIGVNDREYAGSWFPAIDRERPRIELELSQ